MINVSSKGMFNSQQIEAPKANTLTNLIGVKREINGEVTTLM